MRHVLWCQTVTITPLITHELSLCHYHRMRSANTNKMMTPVETRHPRARWIGACSIANGWSGQHASSGEDLGASQRRLVPSIKHTWQPHEWGEVHPIFTDDKTLAHRDETHALSPAISPPHSQAEDHATAPELTRWPQSHLLLEALPVQSAGFRAGRGYSCTLRNWQSRHVNGTCPSGMAELI